MFQSQPRDPSPQNQRRRQMFLVALFALGVLVLGRTGLLEDSGFLGGGLGNLGGSTVRYQAVRDAEGLERLFDAAGYDLQAVASGKAPVPQLFIDTLPPGWADLPVADRQRLFIAAMLPLVLSVNAQMNDLRDRLATIADAPDAATLSDAELALAKDVAAIVAPFDGRRAEDARRDAAADPIGAARVLSARVGPLPVAFTLAQAAQDSDWGTTAGPAGQVLHEGSRREQALYDPAARAPTGPFASPYLPPGRGDTADDAADARPGLRAQLMAHAMSLSFAPEHAAFRTMRERLEAAHAPLQGEALAAAMIGDGDRPDDSGGAALQAFVAAHGLDAYDTARLDRPPALVLVNRPRHSKQSEPSG